jgi:uncharacterized membrane protein
MVEMMAIDSLVLTIVVFVPVVIILASLSRQVFQGPMRNAGYAFAAMGALMAASLISTPMIWSIFSTFALILLVVFIGLFVMVGIANLRYRLQSYQIRSRIQRDYARSLFGRTFRFHQDTGEFEEAN